MYTDLQKAKINELLDNSKYMVEESLSMSEEQEYYKGRVSAIEEILDILNDDGRVRCPSCNSDCVHDFTKLYDGTVVLKCDDCTTTFNA